ncbi:tetratricopeptide repeat protein [Nanoarchaeota archaeon]
MKQKNIEHDYIKGENHRHFELSSYGKGSEIDPKVMELESRKKAVGVAAVLLLAVISVPFFIVKPSIQGFAVADLESISTAPGFAMLVIGSLIISVIIIEVISKGFKYPQEKLTSIEEMLHKAEGLLEKNKFKQALSLYNKVLVKEPENDCALLNKGFAYDLLGDHMSAISIYNKILGKDSKNQKALYNKGMAFIEINKLHGAAQCFSKVLKIKKNDMSSLRKLCFVFFSRQEYNETISFCDKALKVDNNNIDMLVIKGLSLERLGKERLALKEYEKALKIDALDAWAFKCKYGLLKKLKTK